MFTHQDGSLGDILPQEEILNQLNEAAKARTLDQIKTVHFGTKEELTGIKTNAENYNELNKKIDDVVKTLNEIMVELGIEDKSKILVVRKISKKFLKQK
jgi:hypothetical protein